jgi:hypothetical protein
MSDVGIGPEIDGVLGKKLQQPVDERTARHDAFAS